MLLQIRKRKRKLPLTEFEVETENKPELEPKTKKQNENKSLETKLITIMKNHIGKENSITNSQLLLYIFGENFQYYDIYKKYFYWNFLKKIMSYLRKQNKLFVINTNNNSYVLKTEIELNALTNKIDNTIFGLMNLNVKAKEWVIGKKWKNL